MKNYLEKKNIITLGKKKKELIELVKYAIKQDIYYSNNIFKIIKIQSLTRKLIVKNFFKYKGPDIKYANNDEDFYTFEPLKDLVFYYIFSYRDKNNFVFSFDVRSFEKLLENDCLNPYTRFPIDIKIINSFNIMKKLTKILGYNCSKIIQPILSDEQSFKQKALSIFHQIDELDYHTDVNWFLNLNIKQLQYFYKSAEDIWNYRAEISLSNKNKIIPNKKAFNIPVWNILKIQNKRELQIIVLNEIEKFVSLGYNREDRTLGAMYMLTALVEVSPACANAMPWLIQSVF